MPHQTSQDRPLNPNAPGPSSSTPPSAFASGSSGFFQRRRSSAAHRPAGPPPNLPIPNVPVAQPPQLDPSVDPPEDTPILNGRAIHTSSSIRPSPSPSLAAVVSFHHPPSHTTAHSSEEDLSDPPPPSILPPSSSRILNNSQEISTNAQPPQESRRESKVPSSRRALTKALELAREAVQLDSMNDNPVAAVQAYGRSVALLSEVMERVRRGEDSTESRSSHRKRRRRSLAAQEEEIRRLQNIHDTYADRMNILSIIYNIPSAPYPSTMHSALSRPTSISPTSSTPPSSDSSPQIPQGLNAPTDFQTSNYFVNEDLAHDRDFDSTDALNTVMFNLDDSNYSGGSISGLPYSSHHPYATSYASSEPINHPSPPAYRPPTLSRRGRVSSNLPPPQPPPTNSLPPAPSSEVKVDSTSQQKNFDIRTHRREDSVGGGPGLEALKEEHDDTQLDLQQDRGETSKTELESLVPDTPRNSKRDSHPLPPLPYPSTSPETPRPLQPPRSPQLSHIVVSRPRGSSQLTTQSEFAAQGAIYPRRTPKSSAPPTPRSSSPADSIISVTASSLPAATPPVLMVRGRSSSQPGRRPSIIGGRISPLDQQRPPLPGSNTVNGSGVRKPSIPTRLNPTPQPAPLRMDLLPAPGLPLAPSQALTNNIPTTPTSPLPPTPPDDPLLKPYHLMNLLRNTMTSPTGGYVTRRLHVPHEVWSQGGAKLSNVLEKVRVVAILCTALEDLQGSSAEHFGAGNVCSGLALGIGSIGRREADAWLSKLEEFSSICDGVVTNFGKKLGVGEGFVIRKTTWSGKLTRGFDKITNGKNLDSPATYVRGLEKLFQHTQLLDEHTKAVLTQPSVPAYAAFPPDIRTSTEQRLKRASEFFASVVLTFVIRDLSQLLDKYAKKCEKWLAE
ncbi:hypothetical protein C0995_002570 [Termitomyces sp. Mi166|nr:hypothetical protein C0995_002570 [Termitomyces sp. Mi166\